MSERPRALKYTGGYTPQGEPLRWFANVPARDLDEGDIAQLSDEQLANITGGPDPLYVAPKAAKEPAEAKGKP